MAKVNILGVPHVYELTAPAPQAEVLVFIHGWLLSRAYWQPMVTELAQQYACLTYDLRGFGASTQAVKQRVGPSSYQLPEIAARSPYSLAAYAEDLICLLGQLNVGRAWLLGHSLGGSIALWAAYLAPQHVSGVICVNAGGGIFLKEDFERFRAAGRQIVRFRPVWLRWLPLLDLVFARAMVNQPLARAWGQQRLKDFIGAHPEAALGALLESTTEKEVHLLPQIVAALEQPAYFISGQQDQVMESQYVNHLASFHRLFQTPQGNVVELAQCGHMAMLEQPLVLTKVVQEILARHTAPSPA
ncbi:MAG: alpha/beta hydrolase [Leptolyngbyaceae cyanobacterium SM1_1_3]|nr:alpha/beta hydrolase [Leptolyngbyaceae cyanobacterium SM1_1_3]NJN02393.1 alpha/beta hydrolase [Leptolyngbyaceae cyanobacterium RM1_1_2]NJO10373.1 alpha/beta hydrolase [Leptolyngbyaceae cyanobacterium SL_1_1]